MGIPARESGYGSKSYTENFDTVKDTYQNGVLVDHRVEPTIKRVHAWVKEPHTKNKLQLIPGTSSLWRPPSTYTRSVINSSYKSGVWSQPIGIGTVQHVKQIFWWDTNHDRQEPYGAFYWNGPYVAWDASMESEAIAKALAKIKDKKASIGENLATARQTANMIVENGTTLMRAALALKRGNLPKVWEILKDGRSAVKQGANYYLQYKYGWKPLMSDIHGATELLREQMSAALLISASAKSQKQDISIRPNSGTQADGKGFRQCQVKLYGRVTDKTARLRDRLGVSNPLSLAWELVPFSFVVDWFVPIGSTLETWTEPAGLDFVGGCCTFKGELTVRSWIEPSGNTTGPTLENNHQGFSIARRTYGGWPKAGLYSVNPISNSHGLSALALLIQMLKSN